MNAVTTPPAPPAPKAPPSAIRRFAARHSGTAVSLLVHGAFVLTAFLSVAAPRTGRGGGIVGSSEAGSGAHDYSAIVQRGEAIDADKPPDVRLFPQAEPDAPETPEAVVPPADDFIRDQPTGETTPVAKPPPAEDPTLSRPKRTHEKLPPSGGGEIAEGPPKSGSDQKGNSTVNGTGGDTGGAGDGTSGALFMPSPDYPASARRRGIEGVVVVSVFVQPDGHCEGAQIVEGSGCEALDDAALTTIRKWRYEPHAGGPELRRVRFVFKLKK